MTKRDIANELMILENEDGREDDEEEETTHLKIKLSVIRSQLDDLITDNSSDNKISLYSTHLHHFKELIIF